ncbi:MAG: methyltransferase domain-containing protein, partial [Pygmaiobacter sp.]
CCPVCGKVLRNEKGALCCKNNHSFDIAAEGYTHLLPANRMHSAVPGDDKQMVAARRRFLDAGYYEPFARMLCDLAAEPLRGKSAPVLLDAGCGEGYYTAALSRRLKNVQIAGFDISKFAVKAAAKRYQTIEFSVASIFHIPVLNGSVDVLVDVFAPVVPTEFSRCLRHGGTLIYAVPGARHLFGLKEILYEHPYENEVKNTEYKGFRFLRRVSVQGEIKLSSADDINALFSMTPYYWNTPKEGVALLRATKTLTTEIAFDFLLYTKI